MAEVEKKIAEMGLKLAPESEAIGLYVNMKQVGNLAFFSGTGPTDDCDIFGRLGAELSVEEGATAARSAALNLISDMKRELGDLDRVVKIVQMVGYVASTPDFYDQPKVVNGASELLIEVFGEKGKHARAAIS